jgi:hypothetical protein
VVGRWQVYHRLEDGHDDPQKGSLWHACRRKWATERKHLPTLMLQPRGGATRVPAWPTPWWRRNSAVADHLESLDAEEVLDVCGHQREPVAEARGRNPEIVGPDERPSGPE